MRLWQPECVEFECISMVVYHSVMMQCFLLNNMYYHNLFLVKVLKVYEILESSLDGFI